MTDTDRAEVHGITALDKLMNGQAVTQEWVRLVEPDAKFEPIILITIEGAGWKARAQLERISRGRYRLQKITYASKQYLEAEIGVSADSKRNGKGA